MKNYECRGYYEALHNVKSKKIKLFSHIYVHLGKE